jgi:DNA polymerase-3 subunit alpha
MIEPAADYSFNKSHAACYAYISYQTAYLKAHHPLEFHAALLRSVEEDTEKLAKFIDEIKLQ